MPVAATGGVALGCFLRVHPGDCAGPSFRVSHFRHRGPLGPVLVGWRRVCRSARLVLGRMYSGQLLLELWWQHVARLQLHDTALTLPLSRGRRGATAPVPRVCRSSLGRSLGAYMGEEGAGLAGEGWQVQRAAAGAGAADRLLAPFQGLGEEADGYCDTITAVAEVIKLTDPSLLYLEVSTLVSKYPDIR